MPDAELRTISATESPALYGVSPYITPFMLYEKFANGLVIEKDPDNRMDAGKKLQSYIVERSREELGLEVIPNAGDEYVRGVGDFALMGCTRDAEIIAPGEGPGALETKMVFDYRIWMDKWDGGNAPPAHVEIQTQQQMAVGKDGVSFTWGVIAVFVCGEMRFYRRKPEPKFLNAAEPQSIPTMAAKFFADVAAKNAPEPTGEIIELKLINEVFPTLAGKRVDFVELLGEDQAREWAEKIRLMEYHASERLAHKKGEDKIKAEIIALMKDAETGVFVNGITAKLKQQHRAGYTVNPSSFKVLSAYVPGDLGDPLQAFRTKGEGFGG